MSSQPESAEAVNEQNTSVTTPLLEGEAKVEAGVGPLIIATSTVNSSSSPSSPNKTAVAAPASPTTAAAAPAPASPSKQAVNTTDVVAPVSPQPVNEYRFVHLRIPPRDGKLRFLLPILLLAFQLVFIILFAFFGHYQDEKSQQASELVKENSYPMFIDLHAIAILGFGFIMTFLKRYGYGSIGFNLLLVAFVIQWALIIRGWTAWGKLDNLFHFSIGIENLVYADFTAIAVLVSFGAVLGKTTLTQLIVLAIIEVVVQILNEHLNINILNTYDVGRSVYVHLFGAVFGRAVSKLLHCKGVQSNKQAPVYHSDLFALIGTLFLFVYYPSFNGLLAHSTGSQSRAIVNTVAAICASCVATFGVSSLAGRGRLNVLHVQHATIAGGIAIGSVVDLNVQIYVALIVGAVAGFLATIGYQYLEPILNRKLKIHDSCGVFSLHGIPGIIAALLGAIFACCTVINDQNQDLLKVYKAFKSASNPNGREGIEQAGFQLIGLVVTIGVALVTGALTGLFLRLPIFEQLSEDVEMFDDEAQWITPDDYALKLTFAANNNNTNAQQAAASPAVVDEAKKEDSKV